MGVWKQPIPVNLDEIFGEDYISRLIYIEVLLKCTNKPRVVNRNGKITRLQRGQCYFTITELAKRLNRNRKTIRKYLDLCQNLHNAMDIDIDRFGCVISVKNYDSVTSMDNGMDNERTTSTHKQERKSERDIYIQVEKPKSATKITGSYALASYVAKLNEKYNRNFKPIPKLVKNFTYWATVYSKTEIDLATHLALKDPFWHDKFTPTKFFRSQDKDHIGDMLERYRDKQGGYSSKVLKERIADEQSKPT